MPKTPAGNTLSYGDNLNILREHVADESVDLVYLDPPFNSNATYNVLFKAPDGHKSQAQIEAFDDTWHWNTSAAEQAFDEVIQSGNSDAAEMRVPFPKIQIIKVEDLFKPSNPLQLPWQDTSVFKKAAREKPTQNRQNEMDL